MISEKYGWSHRAAIQRLSLDYRIGYRLGFNIDLWLQLPKRILEKIEFVWLRIWRWARRQVTAIRNRVLYAPGGILAPSGERFRTLADPSSSGLLTLRFKRLRIR